MKQIIFGSSNHWNSPYQVGSHAWARMFASGGWQVGYVSDPLTPWHLVGSRSKSTMQRFEIWKKGVRERIGDGEVHGYVPMAAVASQNVPLFRSKWVLENWSELAIPSVPNWLHRNGFHRPDLIWLDSIRAASWAGKLNGLKKILRLADWTAGFPRTPPSILELERTWIEQADLVVTSAESLTQKIQPLRLGRPLVTIRNGVDVDTWKSPLSEPVEYASIPHPRVVYVGALDAWFDDELVDSLARTMSEVHFVIIGQKRTPLSGEGRGNIHWMGPRSKTVVRSYLQHADLGMIPFRRSDLIECVCPLKLYEYMACGLPVIATRWDELERMQSPAVLAEGVKEWKDAIESLLHRSTAEQLEFKLKHQTYATQNDWKSRWSQLSNFLSEWGLATDIK